MGKLQILGVGWREDDLTLGAVKALRAAGKIILRTGRCGCADWLKSEGLAFDTLDALYDQCVDFDELIDVSAQTILSIAQKNSVAYCVNDLSDKTCVRLCQLTNGELDLLPGVSEGNCLLPFAGEDVRTVSAADADLFEPDAHMSTLVRELDSPMLASDIKLRLTERYPDELNIFVCDAAGQIRSLQLCDLDRLDQYDHRMCALIPAVRSLDQLERYDVRHLEEIMRRLRDFDGCPWDREQTHESLRRYLVEEAYEAVDAIDRDDMDGLYDELGDVLLQVVFHADIARQFGEFELSDITTAICRKMIRRHPHVFGNVQADNADTLTQLWNEIKKQEKAQKTGSETMKSVAGAMPALMRAAKVCKRARQHEGVLPDGAEAWSAWTKDPSSETLGRLFMALAGCAEEQGIEPELSLNEAIGRFIRHFEKTESEK